MWLPFLAENRLAVCRLSYCILNIARSSTRDWFRSTRVLYHLTIVLKKISLKSNYRQYSLNFISCAQETACLIKWSSPQIANYVIYLNVYYLQKQFYELINLAGQFRPLNDVPHLVCFGCSFLFLNVASLLIFA